MSEAVNTSQSHGARSRVLRDVRAAACLVVLAIIPFLPAMNGQFMWDDDVWLVDNAAVHAWNGLRQIWNPLHQTLHFYPITFTLLWLEHKLWGLQPLGYHLSNMAAHAGAAVVLWISLRRLGLKGAWLAALVWAVHPVQVESVAWVAEIKNTLSGFLFFAALWAYLRFELVGDEPGPMSSGTTLRRRWGFYGAAFVLFVVALLAKTVVCTLPAVLLLLLWWRRRNMSLRTVLPLIPMLIVGLAIARWTTHQESVGLIAGGADTLVFTPLERCIIAGKDFWFYLRTLIVPFPLMAIYPRWNYATGDILNYLPMIAAAALGAGLWIARKAMGNGPLVGVLLFVVMLSPALGFINFFTMHYTFVADHYQYLACAGILVPLVELCVVGSQSLANKKGNLAANRALPRALAVVVCVILMALATFYASLFQTNLKLWSWNVAKNPAAFTAQHNLAVAYFQRREMDLGDRHLDIALAEQPEDDNIQRTVGKRLLMQGDYAAALSHFQKAAAVRPNYGITYMLLGDAYSRMNRMSEALAAYEKSIAIDGGDPQYYVAYAAALQKNHQYDQAANAYAQAILLAPGNMITRYNYANLLLDMRRFPAAIAQYQFILQYQKDNPLVWHNLAYAYYQSHQLELATAAEQHAAALDAAVATRPAASAP